MNLPVSRDLLRQKLAEAVAAPVAAVVRRDLRVPQMAGKAIAVVGVRRAGKTSFLMQRMRERMAEGRPRESQLLLSLEDERLVGMTAVDLGWMLEEYERQAPGVRGSGAMSVYFDEIHVVPGWETLVRRVIDSGGIEVFVCGSSARLLSREVATSLRGRAMEVLVHPFSFREALRYADEEPNVAWERLSPTDRAAVDAALRRYLDEGGFPEAQQTDSGDRVALLKGYVDVMVLRDVVERYNVTNTHALRWLQRYLLTNPGGNFSIKKLYDSLRSQGMALGKDILYEYLDHLEDSFLIRTISMHSASERQRMSNPRKAYPIDPGLVAVYERTRREHRGRTLETAVLLELERRRYETDWLRTTGGLEVDFFAERPGERPLLLQVSLDTEDEKTWSREVAGLVSAAKEYPEATPLLVTADSSPPMRQLPARLRWRSAADWLLEAWP